MSETRAVTHWRLFAVFPGNALSGIGGAMPYARLALVVRHGWLGEREFADALATSQLLPGPNIVNVGIMVVSRIKAGLARGTLL